MERFFGAGGVISDLMACMSSKSACAQENLVFSTVFPLPNPLPQVGEGIAELRG